MGLSLIRRVSLAPGGHAGQGEHYADPCAGDGVEGFRRQRGSPYVLHIVRNQVEEESVG